MTKLNLPVIMLFLVPFIILYLVYLSRNLKRVYQKEVQKGLELNQLSERKILTAEDLQHLPDPVRNYLLYVGVVGKEKVHSVKVSASGKIKLDPTSGWKKNQVEQYNFFGSHLTRLFHIKLKMFGIPIIGLHTYADDKANMLIKLAGLITVANVKGPEMRISDTITLLNDMCLFAPATLIDRRIQWEPIDDLTVKATFHTDYCKVSATLYFNGRGELVNFVSDDRYYLMPDASFKKVRWSTPFENYQERDGLKLASTGAAIWSLPEGDFCYFKFTDIEEIVYN